MAKYSSSCDSLYLEYLSGTALVMVNGCSSNHQNQTHSKQMDVVQDLVVEGEIIAGNDVDTSLFLKLPMVETQSFTLTQQFILLDLACPKRFGSFLQITVYTHAREAED
jgi:hypothetical protein